MRFRPCPKRSIAIESNPLEETEQIAVVQWLRLHKICFHASPNGGYRHPVTANRMKALGCSAGVPDLLIFDAPPAYNGKYCGAAIEMKRRKGGKVSDEQQRWIDDLSKRGWLCCIAFGMDDAIEFLERCGY